MRIFLDANVLFAAAKTDGAVSELIGLLRSAGHECCADEYVIEEARRNLRAKWPDRIAILDRLLTHLTIGRMHSAVELGVETGLPTKDLPVLAAAIGLRCDVLATGDRSHFGGLYGEAIQAVTIHSPRSLAELLLTKRA